LIFQHDPAVPTWFDDSLALMKMVKGLNVRAVDPKGKFLWENLSKSTGDTLTAQSEIFLPGLAAHAKASGWKDRLAETQNLLGRDGNFGFTAEALRWAASHDISDASIPKGQSKPTVTPEQVDAWIKRGTDLAAIKESKAQEKGNSRLAGELAPFSGGLSLDPMAGGWNKAVGALKTYLAKDSSNPTWAGKLFEILNREPSALALENNAFDLAQHLATAENPHSGIKSLVEFAGKSTDSLKIQGSFFGSFLKMSKDTGAKAEVEALNDMVAQAGVLTAKGKQVVIEAIPTSKLLDGKTPDFAVTVTEGALKSRYIVEVKRAAKETVNKSGANDREFTSELDAGYGGKKSDDSTLGSLIGKGLYQLGAYKGKDNGDYLVLNVRLEGEPPVYFEAALKRFLAANCPGIVVKLQYKTAGSASTTEMVLRADGSSARYSPYDANSNFFAPSLPAAASK
jgi:hypothetical protein